MAEERVQRRLAAILAADVVGYSRLMEADEEGTRARLRNLHSELIDPRIAVDGGRIVKTMGDGILVEFPSAVDAVRNALAIQAALADHNSQLPESQRLLFRVGINVGDVIIEGEDIHGDGVNIAARLEALCQSGEVYLSGSAHEQVVGKLDASFDDLGEHTVKNIKKAIRVYRVSPMSESESAQTTSGAFDSLFDRPAVAVLPFENISGDPEQEYFADGLTEDIITALSLWRSFPVIARNSSFAYKGQSPDVRKVGKELGARYVVEGSVRKAGNRVRITAQLIDTDSGHHEWAERYDRELLDIFELQDEITERIAAILEPAIASSEQKRLTSKPPKTLDAWDLCVQGYGLLYQGTKETNELAREKFNQSIALDPNYARPWTGIAYTYGRDWRLGFSDDREAARKQCLDAARRAVAIDASDSEARVMLARSFRVNGQIEIAMSELQRAIELNPQNSTAHWTMGSFLYFEGQAQESIPCYQKALEINPLDPRNYVVTTHLAIANVCVGDYEAALDLSRRATGQRPDYIDSRVALAAALGHLGRTDEARQAIGEFREKAKDYLENHPDPIWHKNVKGHLFQGLQKAGLVE